MIIALSPSKPDFHRVTSCSGQERIKMEIVVVGDLKLFLTSVSDFRQHA
jgi:hypothetical protein